MSDDYRQPETLSQKQSSKTQTSFWHMHGTPVVGTCVWIFYLQDEVSCDSTENLDRVISNFNQNFMFPSISSSFHYQEFSQTSKRAVIIGSKLKRNVISDYILVIIQYHSTYRNMLQFLEAGCNMSFTVTLSECSKCTRNTASFWLIDKCGM